ncbi:uncharacterized protein LOC108030779 isoform X2 [Drosophila biarmipes]|uniref:uncharacterized protein LOC108030779 isoform X2 n=1 Tax=Drosophila biarmipes TaxID=125945 RepID=UPI0007E824A9|nr:uncharacterized protein LOC108030779 isoform X2 [Drosophila biarmipes]
MMVCVPALNLFLYNCLVVYIARKVQRIINVPSTNASWPRIPLIGRVFGLQPGDPPSDGVEFHDVLWNVNLHVNFLLLLPALFQRLLDFYLKLVCHLWWSDLGWAYYVPLVFFGLVMNTLHLTLIVGTMKLQTKGPEDPHAHSESEIQSLSLAQQEMVGSVAMGDVPER